MEYFIIFVQHTYSEIYKQKMSEAYIKSLNNFKQVEPNAMKDTIVQNINYFAFPIFNYQQQPAHHSEAT